MRSTCPGWLRRGLEVAVRTTHDATGERGHYNHLLEKHGLGVSSAGQGRKVSAFRIMSVEDVSDENNA